MKYITTETNPVFKTGYKVENANNSALLPFYDPYEDLVKADFETNIFKDWIDKGYIKEVEEKEWTESDMIDFVHFAVRNYSEPYYNIIMARSDFNKWKQQRNNKS